MSNFSLAFSSSREGGRSPGIGLQGVRLRARSDLATSLSCFSFLVAGGWRSPRDAEKMERGRLSGRAGGDELWICIG